jgi:ParB-like nuclease domain
MVNSEAVRRPVFGEMKVEIWPIERLIPYPRNPRQIPQIAVDKVARSIQEFGFRQPIVVDTKGVIIVGHVRLLAAQLAFRSTEVLHQHQLTASLVPLGEQNPAPIRRKSQAASPKHVDRFLEIDHRPDLICDETQKLDRSGLL